MRKYSIWDRLKYILTLLFVAIDVAVLWQLLDKHPLSRIFIAISGLLLMVTQIVLFARKHK